MYSIRYMIAAVMGCCVFPLFALTSKNKMMKELDVKKVSMANIPVESVPALLDEEKVAFQPVNTVNWAAYPYCPDVKFRMAYADNAILIHYKVKENSIRAVTGLSGKIRVWGSSPFVRKTGCIIIWNVTVRDACLSVREQGGTVAGMRRRRCSIRCSAGLL